MPGAGSGGNVIAALLSFFLPGLGQLTQGRVGEALVTFFVLVCAYVAWPVVGTCLLIPAVHIYACVNAARWQGED